MVGCYVLCVVWCFLYAAHELMNVDRLPFVVWFVVGCVCCLSAAQRCIVCDVCCLLQVVTCFVICRLMFVVRCAVFVGCVMCGAC